MPNNKELDKQLAIEKFHRYLRSRNLSEVTVRSYTSAIRSLARAYRSEFGRSPTPQTLASSFSALVDRKIIAPYNPRRIAPIKHYFAALKLSYPLKELEEELSEFGEWLISEGYSKSTAKTYRYGLRKHLRKLGLIETSSAIFDFRNADQAHRRAVALYAKFAELTGRMENDPLAPYPWYEHEAFKDWLTSKYSPQTVRSYIRHYRAMVAAAGGCISEAEVLTYIRSLDKERTWLNAQRKTAARHFLAFRKSSAAS